MDFVVIDVETANPNLASICQVGIADFRGGVLHSQWDSLVNPDDYFDGMNVSIHGIEEHSVRFSPKWRQIHEELAPWLSGKVVVSHSHFDRAALTRACLKLDLGLHPCRWLNSAMVVRRAWPDFAKRGYGLGNISKHLAIEFKHHDAKEDARAAGEVLLKAIQVSGLGLEEWFVRVQKPISLVDGCQFARPGAPEGPLFGEVLTFTGALSLPRKEAAALAAQMGCEIEDGVTKHTTMVVVGDQDIRRLAGHNKSTKHR